MKRLCILAALLLTACASEAESLERQYEIASDAYDDAEKCRIARLTQDAWLREENERKYSHWRMTASFDCLRV